jgi:hypothetical protein
LTFSAAENRRRELRRYDFESYDVPNLIMEQAAFALLSINGLVKALRTLSP